MLTQVLKQMLIIDMVSYDIKRNRIKRGTKCRRTQISIAGTVAWKEKPAEKGCTGAAETSDPQHI